VNHPSPVDDETSIFVLTDDHLDFHQAFQRVAGTNFNEWLKDFVLSIKQGDLMAATLELKNVTGDHLAEANAFVKELFR
jgi:hypothetical protein